MHKFPALLTILALLMVCYPVFGQRFPRTVNTIADLVNYPISASEVNTNFVVLGYSSPGDGGGGDFYWHVGSASTTNAGTIFASTRAGVPLSKFKRKYSGHPSPRWAGATGNNTDDTAAFQAMLYLNEGLFVPDGIYVISELDVPNNSIISGQSFNAVLRKKDATVTYILGSTTTNLYLNITIRNLSLNGNKANATAGGGIALAGNNIEINNVFIYDTPDAGINLGYRAGGGNYRILNNYFSNCSKVGNNYGAIAVTGGNNILISGNQITCTDAGQHYGIDIEPNSGTPASEVGQVTITGNTIRGGTLQVDFSNVTGPVENVIVENNIVDARGAANTGQDNMAPLFHRNYKTFKVTGNIVYQHATATTPFGGMYSWGLSNGEVSFNTFYCRDVGPANERIVYFDDASPSSEIVGAFNRIISTSGVPAYGFYAANATAVTNLYLRANIGYNIGSLQNLNSVNVHDWATDLEFTNTWHLLLHATNANVLKRLRVGTQTNDDLLIVGSQTATGDAGFGSGRGIIAFADGNSSMAHHVAFNSETNTASGLKQVDVLYNTAGTGLRAAQWSTRKLSTWLPGLETSYITLGLISNGVPVDVLDYRGDLINFNLPVIVQPLTASQLVGTTAGKALQSITLGTGLSLAGTVLNAAASVTINPTDGYIPYRLNSGAFADSGLYFISTYKYGLGGTTKFLASENARSISLGFTALNANTSGADGTAIGDSALKSNTTGIRNTAVGSKALELNVIGQLNTAIGYAALRASTNLNGGNTAVGDSALSFLTSGIENNASGANALASLTSGSRNVVNGRSSAEVLITGSDVVAIGAYAAQKTTVSETTAVGAYALNLNTNGTANVAFGFHAAKTNSGSFNTAIGNSALKANTTGSHNTALGALTATASIADTNSIVIGSNVTGAGNNTTVIGNTNTTAAHIIASGYAGGGTKFLSDDGTYKTATGSDATATSWQAIGSGTDHSYVGATATFEKISFGTSGPGFTLTNAGTYAVTINLAVFDSGSFSQSFWLTNVTDNISYPGSYRSALIATTDYGVTLPIMLQITTAASNKNFELWGQTHNATYTSAGVTSSNTVVLISRLY